MPELGHYLKQLQNDLDLIRQYMSIHATNKLAPNIIDPTHLRQELIKIQSKLIPTLALPEDPYTNIWHYYTLLTVAPMNHDNKLVLMINIPLVDPDSKMTLYKIHNLPIFEPRIKKSLEYQIEGYNLAVTKDNKYAALLTNSEFITCILAAGHFCSLSTGLYNIGNSKWCILSLYLKNNKKIVKNCRVEVNNITGPQARYLNQGLWAIAVSKPIDMEIQCQTHKSVKNLQPPMTMVTLEPACSAFSSEIKLPAYFRQYPNGFDAALRAANLHIPQFNPSSFRIWNHFNISNLTIAVTRKLQKLPPAPSVPVDQLKALIQGFKDLDDNKNDESWINIVRGGSGSGLILLIVIGVIVCWCCKKTQSQRR